MEVGWGGDRPQRRRLKHYGLFLYWHFACSGICHPSPDEEWNELTAWPRYNMHSRRDKLQWIRLYIIVYIIVYTNVW